ncbi:MAG: hypothetical protein MHM6MM_007003 [Cercozoa sp. M6MM]
MCASGFLVVAYVLMVGDAPTNNFEQVVALIGLLLQVVLGVILFLGLLQKPHALFQTFPFLISWIGWGLSAMYLAIQSLSLVNYVSGKTSRDLTEIAAWVQFGISALFVIIGIFSRGPRAVVL